MNPFAESRDTEAGISEWGHSFYLGNEGNTLLLYVDGNEVRMTKKEARRLGNILLSMAAKAGETEWQKP